MNALTKAQRRALQRIAELCERHNYALKVSLKATRGISLSSVNVLLKRGLVEYFDAGGFNCEWYQPTEAGRAALASAAGQEGQDDE